jgi:hypothetical protein
VILLCKIEGYNAQMFDNLVECEVAYGAQASCVKRCRNFVSNLNSNWSDRLAFLPAKLNKRFKREFDPGSESTLAARLTHASRTRKGAILSKVAYG